MIHSSLSIGSAQAARVMAWPGAMAMPIVPRDGALELFRQRNALLDSLFYDVGTITAAEARRLGPLSPAEGAVLVVPPSGRGELAAFADAAGFTAARRAPGAPTVATLVVAGVGSSALGAAAFARNVADAVAAPVAAVISGFDLADLLTEALGGFFWFGAVSPLRHRLAELDEWLWSSGEDGRADRASRDTDALLALLDDESPGFDLLVGHAKGSVVIAEALLALGARNAGRLSALGKAARIVTLGARIAMPEACRRVIDVIGALDSFGQFNSRRSIEADHVVPWAWHHTNTELPLHLPVTETLRTVLR